LKITGELIRQESAEVVEKQSSITDTQKLIALMIDMQKEEEEEEENVLQPI
jgi:hypothetical protein